MATKSLRGIWFLEQLDATEITNWKLWVYLSLLATVIGLFLHVGIKLSQTGSLALPNLDWRLVMIVFLLLTIVWSAWGIVFFARTFEADLSSLPKSTELEIAYQKRLRPTRSLLWYSITANVVSYHLVGVGAYLLMDGSVQALFAPTDTRATFSVFVYFLSLLAMLNAGIATAYVYNQHKNLLLVADRLDIDLLQLDDYSVVANPAVRFMLFMIFYLSAFPLADLLFYNSMFLEWLWWIVVTLSAGTLLILALYLYPVFHLRNRVKDKKVSELKDVNQLLQALRQGTQSPDRRMIESSLLTKQMFLESRWEWPIAAHIQKLFLLGFLPPLTWFLAATIENLAY